MSSPVVRHLQHAENHLQAGHLDAAQAAVEQALRKAPRHPDALMLAGVVQLARGQAALAVPLLERALTAVPDHGAALEHLGLAFLMLSKFAEAEQSLLKASKLHGAPASVHMRLGIAVLEQGRPHEALPALRRAVELDRGDVDAWINLGRAHAAAGDIAAARTAFESASRSAPERPEPPHNIGVLALEAGDLADALRCFEQALRLAPSFVDARLSLGIVHQRQGQYPRALELMQHALNVDPENAAVMTEIGRTLALEGRHDRAREQYLRACSLAPRYVPAHEGLASVCLTLGRLPEAIEHLKALLELEAKNPAAAAALSSALFQMGKLDEAELAAERCLALDAGNATSIGTLANIQVARGELTRAIETLSSGYSRTHAGPLLGMLAYLVRQACDWERWGKLWTEMLQLLEEHAPLGSPFWLLCEPLGSGQLLEYTRSWAEARFGPPVPRPAPPERAGTSRRYRIGYLSSDLHDHATACLIADVMERHNRERFEVHAYSHGPDDGSAMRARMRAAFEHFVDLTQYPDDLAAERIREDQLDLLIDLKGYTLGDRLTIMARRPCALQASWLGYPGTTAATFMDYIIADPVVIPPGDESYYTERVARMPLCYQPNDKVRHVADPLARNAYGLPQDAFVFCCFNQTYKITPDIFDVWMRLLHAVPHSVLWLLESNEVAADNLSRAASARGVHENRIVFGPRLPNPQHLARYRVADLALDTFPYTSHTTMSDALWCGCPALGLCGDTFASRVSTSLLEAAGLPDLVTRTLDQYQALALRLATDAAYRVDVRGRTLRARDESALFDSVRFARDLEALYIRMITEG